MKSRPTPQNCKRAWHLPAVAGQFSQDGSAVVIAGNDHTLRLYASTNGAPRANLTGATDKLISLKSIDGNELRGLTADGRVLSWDLTLPWKLDKTLGTAAESIFSDRICALDFSPDGSLLAVGSGPPSRFGDIKFVDVASARSLAI
ncbi:MAG: WD40 repeat domain-containing protein [Pirellulaceae bacterium]